MGKEKIQTLDNKESQRLFHYEILGIVLLITSMLAITKMGLMGNYLMLIVKVLFGDWYFLIYFLIIIYSIRCILFHNKLKINNIRYLGIFLFILSLILLSHFSMHKYIKEFDGNKLMLTIKLYFNAFLNNSPTSIVGGGIIGAILFYFSYFLLSEIGVIIISIIFIFLGFVFISRKTIKDFIYDIILFFRKIISIILKTKNKIHNHIDKYDLSYKRTKIKYKISKVNIEEYYNKELEFAKRNSNIIKNVLNSMNVFYNEINFIVCRNITVYFIESHYKFSYEAFSRNLSKYLHNYLLKIDDINQDLIVEVNNINAVPLRICEINEIIENEVVFGIDDRNELLKLDHLKKKLIIFGSNKKQIMDYLDSIVLSILHNKNKINYYYINLHTKSVFETSNKIDELNEILIKITNRINDFNELKVSSIDEYNKITNNKIKYELIIINGIDKILLDKILYDKLLYTFQISNMVGYYFIVTSFSSNNSFNNLYNLFDYKVFLDNNCSYSKECMKNFNYQVVNKDIEAVLLYKSILIRYSLLLMTEEEKKI